MVKKIEEISSETLGAGIRENLFTLLSLSKRIKEKLDDVRNLVDIARKELADYLERCVQHICEGSSEKPSLTDSQEGYLLALKENLKKIEDFKELPGVSDLLDEIRFIVQSIEITSGKSAESGKMWIKNIEELGFSVTSVKEAAKRVSSGYLYFNSGVTGPVNIISEIVKQITSEVRENREDARVLKTRHLAIINPACSCGACNVQNPEISNNIIAVPFFQTAVCTGKRNARDCYYDHLSKTAEGLEDGRIENKTIVIQIPPPVDGKINFGPDVGVNISAIKGFLKNRPSDGLIIFEVNSAIPHIPGRELDLSELADIAAKVVFVEGTGELNMKEGKQRDNRKHGEIASQVAILLKEEASKASLEEEKITVQMGIGIIPTMVMRALRNAGVDLDMYSEVIADGVCDYLDPDDENGRKNLSRFIAEGRRITSGLAIGSVKMMRFMAKFPFLFDFLNTNEVNNPVELSKLHRLMAINSATKVTIGGQVAAFTATGKPLSGIGGQADYARAAGFSPGGLSIVTVSSTRKLRRQEEGLCDPSGAEPCLCLDNNNRDNSTEYLYLISKICFGLGQDAATQTIGDVNHIATEYGVTANLEGLTMAEKILEIINIADPRFARKLLDKAIEDGWLNREILSSKYLGMYNEILTRNN